MIVLFCLVDDTYRRSGKLRAFLWADILRLVTPTRAPGLSGCSNQLYRMFRERHEPPFGLTAWGVGKATRRCGPNTKARRAAREADSPASTKAPS